MRDICVSLFSHVFTDQPGELQNHWDMNVHSPKIYRKPMHIYIYIIIYKGLESAGLSRNGAVLDWEPPDPVVDHHVHRLERFMKRAIGILYFESNCAYHVTGTNGW